MLPSQVTVVSQYIMYNKLHLVNTYVPLILPYCLGGGAFFIFLLIQFIRGIPRELDESAKCDGASTFCIYSQIILPPAKGTADNRGDLCFYLELGRFLLTDALFKHTGQIYSRTWPSDAG